MIALNVFEHIADHVRAAKEVYRVLRPGGAFYMEVPGGPNLYDFYDATLLHHRRYSRADVTRLLTTAGFKIAKLSAIGCFAYPAFAATKIVNKLRHGKVPNAVLVRRSIQNASDNAILSASLRLERALWNNVNFPFGIRQVALAMKA